MNRRPHSQTPSDSFWPEMPEKIGNTPAPPPKPVKSDDLNNFLFPKEDGSEFYDPYSELNLFLSQKIKEQFTEEGTTKKWSILLQDKLIEKISPEFQKKFPNYRIGSSSLKKLWDKLAYYSQQMQTQKEAVNPQGKLNIGFLIKENLKQHLQMKGSGDKHPFHYAHQLAIKISDCLATLDGIKPMLENLSKTIWFIQKHLLPPSSLQKTPTPYDEMDKCDKLIIKTILETLGKNPLLSQKELEIQVKESIEELKSLPTFTSLDRGAATVSFLLAEKLYANSSFHTLFVAEEKEAISTFIQRHLTLYKESLIPFQFTELVRRTHAFYSLAAQVPKDLTREEVEEALHSSSPQLLSAFMAQEIRLLKEQEDIYSLYQQLRHLPSLPGQLLEMVIWKELGKQEPFLDELSYKTGNRLQEEIANILIDNPTLAFGSIVNTAVQFFKRAKELTLSKKEKELEEKITLWTMQGDLICRFLKLETDNSLLQLIKELWKTRTPLTNHAAFVSAVAQAYLHKNPEQAPYSPQVSARISILYKYAWYALFAHAEETSLDRFLKWYFVHFSHLEEAEMIAHIEEMAKKQIPLTPLDRDKINSLLALAKEEKRAQENERQA